MELPNIPQGFDVDWVTLENTINELIPSIPARMRDDAEKLLRDVTSRNIPIITEHLLDTGSKWTPPSKGSRKKQLASQPRHYNMTHGPNNKRSVLYKMTQDLFQKNKRNLAEAILSGKELDRVSREPSMEQAETFYRKLYEGPFHLAPAG